MKVAVICDGCVSETAMFINLSEELKRLGVERCYSLEEADIILLILCRGTGKAIEKNTVTLNEAVSYLNVYGDNKKLIVAGCYARTLEVEEFLSTYLTKGEYKVVTDIDFTIPIINFILGLKKRNSLKTYFKNRTLNIHYSNVSVQLMIERGCINNCTFCKVNYSRDALSSTPFNETVNYIKILVENGTKEIILSGDNLTLYGIDEFGKPMLHELIKEISKIPGLKRINLFEITVNNMYQELIDEITTNPLIAMISMQLETASNRLLKLMNRNYTLEDYDHLVTIFQESGKFISTLLMTSFPTETMEDLDETIDYITRRNIDVEAICQYEDFSEVPSHNLPQLPYLTKCKHTKYLVKKVHENNTRIYRELINNLDLILLNNKELDGASIFSTNTRLKVVSYKKKYLDLPLGSEIDDIPKSIVLKNKTVGRSAYRL